MLVVYETDKGNYAVRPFDWAGAWTNGKLKEGTCRNISIFKDKKEAQWYANTKNAENSDASISIIKNNYLYTYSTCPYCKSELRIKRSSLEYRYSKGRDIADVVCPCCNKTFLVDKFN